MSIPTITSTRNPKMACTTEISAWLAALHLASPALPVGGFSYSEGLEAACSAGLVRDEATSLGWIQACLESAFERAEAPAWLLHFRAYRAGDWEAAREWNEWFLTARESLELRRQTEQMGWSMVALIEALALGSAAERALLAGLAPICFPAAAAFAYAAEGVPEEVGLAAFAFAWLENQVAAAIKTVPLGQVAGQRLLRELKSGLPDVLARASRRAAATPPDIETLAPQLAILAARHETQYSRLFRS